MKFSRSIAAAACLGFVLSAMPAASATTFNFFWSGDPQRDPNLLSSGDPAAKVTGTITADVSPGDLLTAGRVTAFDLFVDITPYSQTAFGQTYEMDDFRVTTITALTGRVSQDGTSVSLLDVWLRGSDPAFVRNQFTIGGCTSSGCAMFIQHGARPPKQFGYSDGDAALGSVLLTTEAVPSDAPPPVPLPAGITLSLTGLGALGLLARRRARADRPRRAA